MRVKPSFKIPVRWNFSRCAITHRMDNITVPFNWSGMQVTTLWSIWKTSTEMYLHVGHFNSNIFSLYTSRHSWSNLGKILVTKIMPRTHKILVRSWFYQPRSYQEAPSIHQEGPSIHQDLTKTRQAFTKILVRMNKIFSVSARIVARFVLTLLSTPVPIITILLLHFVYILLKDPKIMKKNQLYTKYIIKNYIIRYHHLVGVFCSLYQPVLNWLSRHPNHNTAIHLIMHLKRMRKSGITMHTRLYIKKYIYKYIYSIIPL